MRTVWIILGLAVLVVTALALCYYSFLLGRAPASSNQGDRPTARATRAETSDDPPSRTSHSDQRPLGEETHTVGTALRTAAVLAGMVVSQAKHAIPDVDVKLVRLNDGSDGEVVGRSRTDRDGRFRFSSLTPGTYEIVAEADGYVGEVLPVRLPTQKDVMLVLGFGGSLIGCVLDSQSGYQIALFGGAGERVVVETFDKQAFRIDAIRPGEYEVQAAVPGGRLQPVASVAIAADTVTDLGDVYFTVGSDVFGDIAIQPAGAPVAGTVTLQKFDGGQFSSIASLKTDMLGGFRFRDMTQGTYRLIVVPRSGAALTKTSSFVVDGDRDVDVGTIEVNEECTLDLIVRGPTGELVSGITPSLTSATKTLQLAREVARGRYRFKGLSEGLVRLTVSHRGMTHFVRHEVRGGNQLINVDLAKDTHATWRGVLQLDSLPVRNASIGVRAVDGSWCTESVATDDNGRFILNVLDNDDLVVSVYGLGKYQGGAHFVTRYPWPSVVDLPTGMIRGRTRPAVQGLEVRVSPLKTSDELIGLQEVWALSRRLRTDEEGGFVVRYLQEGRYRIEIMNDMDDNPVTISDDVVVRSGQEASMDIVWDR